MSMFPNSQKQCHVDCHASLPAGRSPTCQSAARQAEGTSPRGWKPPGLRWHGLHGDAPFNIEVKHGKTWDNFPKAQGFFLKQLRLCHKTMVKPQLSRPCIFHLPMGWRNAVEWGWSELDVTLMMWRVGGGTGSGGMLTFMYMLRWGCYIDDAMGWGRVGWDVNVNVLVTLRM